MLLSKGSISMGPSISVVKTKKHANTEREVYVAVRVEVTFFLRSIKSVDVR
jgi:hypothetical protein